MKKRTLPSIAWSAVLACALTPPGTSLADERVLPTFPSDYQFIHAFVIDDPDNPLFGFHHFYINEKGLGAFKDGGPYPTGTTFLGLVYQLRIEGAQLNEGEGAATVIMAKDPTASETGGWRFAQFQPDGTPYRAGREDRLLRLSHAG
jgi:hypothetical protein